MNCPNCGSELKEGAKFCVECGAPVPETMPEAPVALEEPVEALPEQVEEPVPAEEPTPVEEPVPAEEPTPVEEPVQAEEPVKVEEPVRVEEPAPKTPAAAPVVPVAPEAPAAPEKAAEPEATDSRMLLTTAQYFFLTILFQIPIIGLVFLFVWGLGQPKNLSLKRFSLAMLLMRLIEWVISLAVMIFTLLIATGVIPGLSFQWPITF